MQQVERPLSPPGAPTGLSVVIPCYNAAALLEEQLEALIAQIPDDNSVEIIVSDNRSTDGSGDVARRWAATAPGRVVQAYTRQGTNAARNAGIAAARFEHILLCDADDVVFPEWVASMARAFRNGHLLAGRVVPFVQDVPRHEEVRLDESVTLLTDGFLPFAIGANCGFTKTAWSSVGGFDEDFVHRGDDIEFFWRAQLAGFKLVPVPDGAVWYRERDSFRAVFRQARMTALGRARLFLSFRSHGMSRRPPPVGFARRFAALLISSPTVLRSNRHRRRWIMRLGALIGHMEAWFRIGVTCP